MKKVFAIASFLSALLISCSNKDVTENGNPIEPDPVEVPGDVTSTPKFEPKEYDGLKYQVLSNLTDGAEKPLFVIYLHSHNGSGNDNQKQLKQPSVTKMKDYLTGKKIPAYFLVPNVLLIWNGFPTGALPDARKRSWG